MVASPDYLTSVLDTVIVLNTLAEGGQKAPKKKLQFAQTKVTFLGRSIGQGENGISQEHIETIVSAPKLSTVKQIMSFIGLVGLSSEWIECY